MISASIGLTKPDAGVIATRPATAPEIMPSTEGLRLMNHSANPRPGAAAAAAICVAAAPRPALTFDVTAEPALKPNQPTHRSEAPITESTRLCGAMFSLPNPTRLPRTRHVTRP